MVIPLRPIKTNTVKFKNLSAIIATLLFANLTNAQTLDPSFGQSGITTLPVTVRTGIARQANGKLLAVGYNADATGITHMAMARYQVSGTLDSSFGANGILLDTISTTDDDVARTVLVQPDQKIVVAGGASFMYTGYVNKLVRYTPAGLRDSSFGVNGVVSGDTVNWINDFKVQADGKLMLFLSDSLLRRYNANGSVDVSFGNGGALVPHHMQVNTFSFQTDGKILLAGSVPNSVTNYPDVAIGRLLSDGRIDSTFGVNGVATASLGATTYASKLALDSSGKIVAIGSGADPSKMGFSLALFRFNTNGSLDNSFHNGLFSATPASDYDVSIDIIMAPDQKILIASTSEIDAPPTVYYQSEVIRFNANGVPDSTFGQNGMFIANISGNLNLTTMLRQPDGKIILHGTNAYNSNYTSYVMMRYVINENTGVTSIEPSSPISVYPNPTNNQLFIDMSQAQIKTDCRFELNDITGKVMASGTLKTGVNSISTSSLANGLYLLQITNGAERMVSKVVKE